jgi:hypothetical protein
MLQNTIMTWKNYWKTTTSLCSSCNPRWATLILFSIVSSCSSPDPDSLKTRRSPKENNQYSQAMLNNTEAKSAVSSTSGFSPPASTPAPISPYAPGGGGALPPSLPPSEMALSKEEMRSKPFTESSPTPQMPIGFAEEEKPWWRRLWPFGHDEKSTPSSPASYPSLATVPPRPNYQRITPSLREDLKAFEQIQDNQNKKQPNEGIVSIPNKIEESQKTQQQQTDITKELNIKGNITVKPLRLPSSELALPKNTEFKPAMTHSAVSPGKITIPAKDAVHIPPIPQRLKEEVAAPALSKEIKEHPSAIASPEPQSKPPVNTAPQPIIATPDLEPLVPRYQREGDEIRRRLPPLPPAHTFE